MLKSFTTLCLLVFFIVISSTAQGQVVAGFTAADTVGCVPHIDHFTNTSTGATNYHWDLGNGTTSTLTDVSGSYTAPGTYTVTLIASNGGSSSTYRTTVNVYAIPVVRFSASDTTLCPGVPAVFSSTSILNAPGPATYTWNFGDGSSSTLASPSHAYVAPGDYSATLFVTSGRGCINSLNKSPYIHVYTPPVPGFTALTPYICRSPGNETFTNSTTGTGPFSYLWHFGDGLTSASPSPTHHYGSPGVYSVTLVVTDAHGCIDSLVRPSYMTVGGLSASFTPVPNACLNIPVTFHHTSSSHLISGWDFGDGGTALSEDGVHTYTATGTYPVRLIIYDGTCFDTVFHSVTINHPTGSFSITPRHACPPPTTRTYTASVPAGCTVTWNSLDYGSLGTGTTVSRTYPVLNLFNPATGVTDALGWIDSITMIMTDTHGCMDTLGKRDTVSNIALRFLPSKVDSCTAVTAHLSVALSSRVYDPFALWPYWAFGIGYPLPGEISYTYPYSVTGYSWNFGDGSPLSASPSPTHIYTLVGGVYDVGVQVTTSDGCIIDSTVSQMVKVGTPPPMPTATVTPTHICAGQPTHFAGTASGLWNGSLWSYGDGGSDTGVHTVHVYSVPGIYTGYFYTAFNGCKNLGVLFKDTVYAPGVVLYDSFNCVPRNKITFRDASYSDDSRLWSFGDGTTSTASSVIHTFPAVSTYTVTLIASNSTTGCRDTTQAVMKLAQLNATLTPVHPAVCRDVRDSFSAAVFELSGDSSWVTKYRWFFGGVLTDSVVTTYNFDTIGHSYHTTGPGAAMVVLTDNHGCFDTITSSALWSKPVDTFSVTPPGGCAPLAVNFTDHSIPTPGSTLASYYWSFGDGYTATTFTSTTSHLYSADGTFTLKEIVTDNYGCADTFTSHTVLAVHKPTAGFAAGVPTICARNYVSFINTSTGYLSSLWFFGDGDTSTATAPRHYYSTPGIYTPKLVVTGPFGCTDTLVIPNYIVVNPVPTASFNMSDSFAVCAPFNVNFANTSSGASIFLWSFGDGITSSSATTASDVYLVPGYYRVVLKAYNAFACVDSAVRHVNLFGYSGAFTYTPLSACPPVDVHFTGSFVTAAHVVWDFSDGVTSSLSSSDTISHWYTAPGVYVPKLILRDSFGCTSSSIGADTIKVGNVTPGFIATPNPVCQNDTVVFHDTSSAGVLPVSGWLWTFAPGVTSTLATPSHAYSLAGTYTVTLTVTAAGGGCTGTVTENVNVISSPPAITGPSVVCIGSGIAFTDSATGGVWSSSSSHVLVGSSSGIVTGLSLGVATITYSIGAGCTVTKIVTVNPSPFGITGGSSVCAGATIPLADASPGGVWSSSSSLAAVGSTGIVTGISPGADTIYYTVRGCPAMKAITVNPMTSVTGGTHICAGLTTTLSSSTSGGTWSTTAPGLSVGSSSGVVTGTSSGSGVVTYTPPTGCLGMVTVSVNPPPGIIGGGSYICIGGTMTLTDSVTGGVWSSSNSSVAAIGSSSGVVTGTGPGTATITYNAGGCTITKLISVDVMPPIAGPDHECVATNTTLSNPISGGIWSSNNLIVAIVGSSSGVVTGVVPGTAIISYSIGGGCTASLPITVNPLPSTVSGATYVCLGDTATLHDLTPGGVWSTATPAIGTIGTAGLFTGISGGIDTIHYTAPTGCAATYMVSVIVVPAISGLVPLCAWGDTLTITDADTTGRFSSTLATVTGISPGRGLVTAYSTGVATITYTIALGCVTTSTVTVKPLPLPISGTMHLCMGGTTTLSDASPGGRWSAASTVATVDTVTGLVTGITAGTARITYTIPNGCKTDTPVVFYSFPVVDGITGPVNLCAGQVITLADTTHGGYWSTTGGAATVGSATGVVTGITAGTAVISYSVSNPCGTAVATQTVSVAPAANAGIISGNDSVCATSNMTLTDTSAGGVWAISNSAIATISAGGIVTGLVPGLDTVTYTVTYPTCSSQTMHPIIVNPLPVAGSLTGNTSLCLGDTTIIAPSVGGGVWAHSTTANNMASVAGGVRIKAHAAGVDSVFYTVTNSCGDAKANIELNVGTIPYVAPIQGLPDVCIGANMVLTDSVTGGSWSCLHPAIVTVNNSGLVTGVAVGRDTISYTVANMCGTVTVRKTVSVDPMPDAGLITGDTAMCVGDSVVLNNAVAGGVWNIDNNGVATIRGSVAVRGLAAGAGTLSYSVTNNCGTTTVTRPITVEPLPAGVITQKDRVLSAPPGYASYQWTYYGRPIPGATADTIIAKDLGTYAVIINNSFGCTYECAAVEVSDCPVSDIVIYPNPASSIVYIQWCKELTAKLSAADGRLIEVVNKATQIDMSLLPSAIYTLTLYDEGGHKILTRRITKLSQ